ncbi:MAG: glycosyltransferase [bacterium]
MPYDVYHCVSKNTMKDIQAVYRIPSRKIHMIYNGVDTEFWNPKHVIESDIASRKTAHGRTDRYVVLYYGHAGKSK